MASPSTWLNLLATAKAAFEATKSGVDLFTLIRKHREEPDTQQEADRVSGVFSTYSDDEINALADRMKECAKRFIEEGDGNRRTRCLCHVFKDAGDGNGGDLPYIDDWPKMFKKLKCIKLRPPL